MSETDPATTAPENQPPAAPETDWKAEAEKWKSLSRKNEDTAKANAAAAARLKEIEDAQKTAEQKAAEALAQAQKDAADAKSQLLRLTVANDTGVPAQLLTGSTEEELKASAKALLEFAGKAPGQAPTPDLGQGARGSAAPADPNAWLRNLAGRR